MTCGKCGLELDGWVTCQSCDFTNDSIDGMAEDALWEVEPCKECGRVGFHKMSCGSKSVHN